MTIALQKATAFRQDAEARWRDAIAAAHAAGVARRRIIEVASANPEDVLQVQEILRELGKLPRTTDARFRGRRSALFATAGGRYRARGTASATRALCWFA